MIVQSKSPGGTTPAKILRARWDIVVFMAAALSLAGCSSREDAAPSAATTVSNVSLTAAQRQHIKLYTVTSSPFSKAIETTGAVDFDNDKAVSVLAPFAGPVSQVLVSIGQKVRKGDPLAVVSSPDYAAAMSAYSKAVVTARNARALAEADKDLSAHNGIAQREAAQAQTDAAGAEADREAALQALMALNVDSRTIADLRAGRRPSHSGGIIRAPINGTVVEKLIAPGQLLQAGTTPCFTIADLSKVWIMAQVSSADLGSVQVNDPAEVETGSGTLPGTVETISALVDPDTRSVVARVSADNPGDLLKKQMYVRVLIKSRRASTGLLVPVSAILRDDENLPFVYLAEPGGTYARQHVSLGYRTGDQYEVTEGLQPGNHVVVDGGIFIQFLQSQ